MCESYRKKQLLQLKDNPRFTPCEDWLMCRQEVLPVDKIIYSYLFRLFLRDGQVCASYSQISQVCGLKRRKMVETSVSRLKAHGLLYVSDRCGQSSYFYFLNHKWVDEYVEKKTESLFVSPPHQSIAGTENDLDQVEKRPGTGSESDLDQDEKRPGPGRKTPWTGSENDLDRVEKRPTLETETLLETKETEKTANPDLEVKKRSEPKRPKSNVAHAPLSFEEMYKKYPCKGTRSEACEEWDMLKPDPSLIAEMHQALDNQIRWRQQAGPNKYPNWKHFCRWLKKGGWTLENERWGGDTSSPDQPKREISFVYDEAMKQSERKPGEVTGQMKRFLEAKKNHVG